MQKTASPDLSRPSPELVLFTGHGADVVGLAFSPDGNTLATAGYDGFVIIWDTTTGAQLRKLSGLDDGCTWIGFSPDGSTIAAHSWSGLKLWDAGIGILKRSYKIICRAWGFTSDGHLLVQRSGECAVAVWDPRTRKTLRRFGHGYDGLGSVALSSCGNLVAVTNRQTIALHDIVTGEVIRTIAMSAEQLHREGFRHPEIDAVEFAADGSVVAGVCFDAVRFWETATGSLIRTLRHKPHSACDRSLPLSVAFSPDGETVATGWTDGLVLIDSPGGVRTINAHRTWSRCLAFSPNGALLATGGADHTVGLWCSRTGGAIWPPAGQWDSVIEVAFTPDSESLISVHADGGARVWSADACILRGEPVALSAPQDEAVISPDGKTVAVGNRQIRWREGEPEDLRMVSLDSCRSVTVCSAGEHSRWPLACSPDGGLLAVQAGTDKICLWNTAMGKVERTFAGNGPAAFSPDSKTIATGSAGSCCLGYSVSACLWHVETGELAHTLLACGREEYLALVSAAVFSPDGMTLALGHANFFISLWDTRTGKLIRELVWRSYSDTVSALAFSPDGGMLASGIAYDSAVLLWDVQTGKQIGALTGHTDNVESLAFSPDGAILASGGDDGTVRLWRPECGELIATLVVLPSQHELSPEWIAYTPGGLYTGSAAAEGFVRWQVGSDLLPGDALAAQFRRPRLHARRRNPRS